MNAMYSSSPRGSRALAALSGLMLVLVVTAAVVVGIYAHRNPNQIEFG